jgi:hypothetical protein
MMKKRGQVAIFIILGVLIVAGISVFFLVSSNKPPTSLTQPGVNVNSFLSTCLTNKIRENINNLSMRGGSLNNPLSVNFEFNGESSPETINYLCYNGGDYSPCVNQQPLLFPYFENNLNISDSDVKDCFDQFISNLKSQGQITTSSYNSSDYILYDNKLIINIGAEITTTKASSQEYQNFTVLIPTNMGSILRVAQDVTNKVATTCDFYYALAQNYPNDNIVKYNDLRDAAVIYSIQDKTTNEELKFATRGCVIPPV